MEAQTLSAEVRETRGKGPARQLRMRGLIPAVFYGPGLEPRPITVSPDDVRTLLTTEYRRNQLIELEIAGEDKELAMVKDLAIHPVSRELLHVDFYRVSKDKAIETKVPFEVTGRALGVQKGGTLNKVFRDLPIKARPQDVPASIVVDAGPLDLGAIVTVKDLELPKGVEVTYSPDRRVVLIETKETRGEDSKDAEEATEESAPEA